MIQLRVATAAANLRRAPGKTSVVEAVLPNHHVVTEIGAKQGRWRHVQTILSGVGFAGFMAEDVLEPLPVDAGRVPLPPQQSGLPPAHFDEGRVDQTRHSLAGPRPLGEAGMPRRRASDGQQPDALWAFIDWARVEDPAHRRWKPTQTDTFCNIYAHDYCYAAGVYLPRVWWMPAAIEALKSGQQVPAALGGSVREENANGLHDWLIDFGAGFGWQRTASVEALQAAANTGAVAVICARRTQRNRSGHITVVVPEGQGHNAGEVNGRFLPLQSQAGRQNVRRGRLHGPWWAKLGPLNFDSFVFFFNDRTSRWT
ncbi:hypothetical protein [Sandarakinorhabdus sp.]|uniref:hypothetical protein n=1 Tax=Sandarakinorhabdus sp. TaxID=1916663 RepID=UPI003F713DA8